MQDPDTRIIDLLSLLYGGAVAAQVGPILAKQLEAFRVQRQASTTADQPLENGLTERDAFLITYGDQFFEAGRPPLQTLRWFLDTYLRDAINWVHLLPCFPYSSDDGFSVIDFLQVDPQLGDWGDVAALGEHFHLMFDFVANHVSRQHAWFQAFLRDQTPYSRYFLVVDPRTDLSQVVRPRALPLLTPFKTPGGTRYVWTTFSTDQIDLNYANPRVLQEMTEVLLQYVGHGAEIIRLDAIAYLWKTIGTPCIHLPQTHGIVKLWRAVLDAVAPHVLLITETNVPHAENISYFGTPVAETERTDEAQLVYNFSLAPLTLHALQTGDATYLREWAAALKSPSPSATFFNFIASHDGIGVLPARGILPEAAVQGLVDRTLAHGGQVSEKTNANGSTSAYELNITVYDFLNDPARPDLAVDVTRFLASQAILLALAGVPGIYVHSLFGSHNCRECFSDSGRPRSLNRRKLDRAALEAILAEPEGHERRVFDGYRHMLRVRRAEPAFHPRAGQQVLDVVPAVFAVLRTPICQGRPVLCLVNVSPQPQTVCVVADSGGIIRDGVYLDLLQGDADVLEEGLRTVELAGYQARWLVAKPVAP